MGTAYSHYKAVPVAANSTVNIPGSRIGGFVPTAAGTWTFTLRADGNPDLVLPGIAVPAGNVGLRVDLPVYVGSNYLSSVTTSGGGAGILLSS
jgi:hypothetical protein